MNNSPEFFDLFAQATNDIICRHTIDGHFLYTSPAFERITGCPPSEVINKLAFTYIHPDDGHSARLDFLKALETNQPVNTQYRLRKKNGDFIWVECSVTTIVLPDGTKEFISTSRPSKNEDSSLNYRNNEEIKWKAVSDYLPDYVVIVDRNLNITYVNRVDGGFDKNQILGTNYLNFNTSLSSEIMKKQFEMVFKEGKTVDHETSVEFPDGSVRWYSNKLGPIYIDNTVRSAISISREITELKTLENELRKQNEVFQRFIEEATDIIYKCDHEGFFEFFNPVFEEKLGYKIKSDERLNFQDVVHPDYKDEVKEFYQKQFEERLNNTYLEFPILTKQKNTLWIGQNVQIELQGDWVTGFRALARDITQRKIIEGKLLRSENRNRALLNAFPDTILRLSKEGVILDAKIGTGDEGSVEEDIIGLDFNTVYKNTDKAEQLLQLLQKATSNNVSIIEFDSSQSDQQKTFEARLNALNDKEVICTLREISQQKIIENHLIEARRIAEENARAKEQFLSVMSHEIRTPLNAIVGLTNLLHEEKSESEKLEFISGIKYSTDNLLKIVDDILDFSKIESNNLSLENTAFDINDNIVGVIQTSKFSFQSKNIEVNFVIDPDIPEILIGDPGRLNQIMINLIHNAFKFTAKGEINVKLSILEQSRKTIRLQFEVSDTGIGIPEDKTLTIFQSFSQAQSNTTRKFGGTGLGLTITKQLIELQGGSISVKSQLGEGTTFTFDISYEVSSDQTINATTVVQEDEIQKESLKGLKILIAEDNEMNQLVMAKYLSKWGIRFEIVENGQEAVDQLDGSFNLILLDLEMPVLDGYNAAKIIRQLENRIYKSVPIIAVSASVLSSVKEKAAESGFDDFISKPVDSKELLAKISKYTKPSDGKNLDEVIETNKERFGTQKEYSNFSLINLEYLIESALNDTAYIRKMIKMFIENTPNYIKTMKLEHSENRLEDLQRTAHKFKASINIMGIKNAKILIDKLEENISLQQDLDELHKLISGIEFYSLAAVAELEVYLKSKEIELSNLNKPV